MSKRDEQGLTLSGRTIIRLALESNRIFGALDEINEAKSLRRIAENPFALVILRRLLWLGVQMIDRIGSEKVEAYVKSHEKADNEAVEAEIKEFGEGLLSKLFPKSKCERCGNQKCLAHQTCHHCEDSKETKDHGLN